MARNPPYTACSVAITPLYNAQSPVSRTLGDMARRTVYWHIGPDDPGTAFLAEGLVRQREELAALGVGVPDAGPRTPWHEIEDQVWKHQGLTLLSTPHVARADRAAVGLRLAGLRDVELHLVLLVRDLPTQVHAAWQAGLQHGSTTALATYAARVLDPARSHWQAEEFWTGRDLASLLPRWTHAIHSDRVHVVAAPADPDGLWQAFLTLAGIGDLDRPDGLVPPSLRADLDQERVLDLTTLVEDGRRPRLRPARVTDHLEPGGRPGRRPRGAARGRPPAARRHDERGRAARRRGRPAAGRERPAGPEAPEAQAPAARPAGRRTGLTPPWRREPPEWSPSQRCPIGLPPVRARAILLLPTGSKRPGRGFPTVEKVGQ